MDAEINDTMNSIKDSVRSLVAFAAALEQAAAAVKKFKAVAASVTQEDAAEAVAPVVIELKNMEEPIAREAVEKVIAYLIGAKSGTLGQDGLPHHLTADWCHGNGERVRVYVDGDEVGFATEANRIEGWVERVIDLHRVGGDCIVNERINGVVTYERVKADA